MLEEYIDYCDKKNTLAYKVIGCAMKVYSTLGAGLLESVYRKAMMVELKRQDIKAETEVPINVEYCGEDLGLGFRIDILVENIMILELKSIAAFENIHYKQISNYLNLTNKPLGYLINFNVENFVMGKGYDRIKNFNYTGNIPKWLY